MVFLRSGEGEWLAQGLERKLGEERKGRLGEQEKMRGRVSEASESRKGGDRGAMEHFLPFRE